MTYLTIFGQVLLQFNPKLTRVQSKWDGTRIALQLEGHALGLNLNVTKVSSSLGSLYRSNFIFGCKRVNGPTKQSKKF